MLKPLTGYNNLNQISLTGVRAIIIMGLLMIAPRSFEDMKKVFIEKGILEEGSSDDILRIDINTLKHMGCEVSRAIKLNDYKYVLTKHPFEIPLTSDHYSVIKRIYDKIKDELSVQELLEFDRLFKKISSFIFDKDLYEKFMGISVLKHYDKEIIKELISDCENERTLSLIYKTVSANRESLKEIVSQKLVLRNDKIYLYGYDLTKKANVTLNLQRIVSVKSRKLAQDNNLTTSFNVKFFLKDYDVNSQIEEENILKMDDRGFTVEGKYFNEFVATQRIISFGSDCKVLEPVEFRNKIISKLKEMKKVYEK